MSALDASADGARSLVVRSIDLVATFSSLSEIW
jgi:hypothetical protein